VIRISAVTMAFSRKFKSQPRWTYTISTFLAAISVAEAYAIPRQITSSQLLPSYDYVIIGGGASGLTVADRLTEDPGTTVLVLEIGGFGDPAQILPIYFGNKSTAHIPYLWPGITSVPQPNLGNASIAVEVAQVVGGGSAVNAMMNMRGSSEDYDRWGAFFDETGGEDPDWSWEGILPYFKKVRLAALVCQNAC
jgi:choline dehydrogenase